MTNGLCTPIIGPGLSAGFFPSRPAVASGLAARLQVPIAPGPSNDLARISQYLVATHRDKMYPRTALVSFLIERIEEDYGLTDEQLRAAEAEAGTRQGGKWLSQLIIQLGRRHRQEHPDDDPYAILAAMEFPIYFTTSFSALLEDALKAAERPARVVDFRATARARPAIPATPNRDHPIVVRLFGGFDDPETLVLTEDDHFNYLTTWATNRSNALRGLKSSLTNNNLLLMGFGLDDWDFRVLFRSILCMEGATQLGQLAHVAVQVNPESETIEADAVQQYLEQYYQREANFSLRWDTPSDFLQELRS
jgi:hypothetical protein